MTIEKRTVASVFLASVLIAILAGTGTVAAQEAQPSDDQQGISALWDNFLVFVAVSVVVIGAIGMSSKSMAMAIMPGYLTFALIAVETGHSLLENILYVTLVLIFVGFAFKLWRLEGGGE